MRGFDNINIGWGMGMESVKKRAQAPQSDVGAIKYLMVMAAVFWAGAFIAGKFSVAEFPPFSLTFFRFAIASAIIFIMLVKKEADWSIKREDWGVFLALGVVGMIGYHIFFFIALKYTSPVNAALIAATNPIITTILSVIFLKEKIKPVNIMAIGISFFGVVLIVTNGSFSVLMDMKFNIGDMLMIIAVACWASYAIISKKVLVKYSPLKVTSYAFLVCAVLLVPFVILENPASYMPLTTSRGWISVVYMAIFPSVVGYLIQQMAIKKIGASRSALYVNLVPVFSMVLAFLILHEAISPVKVIAACFIITGVYVNMKFR